AFLWVQHLEEQIDDSYINFNTYSNLNLTNIEENEFNDKENYDYQYKESNDFIETIQLSPNLSQNSSIYTNDNNLVDSFNSQDNIDNLYQNFKLEEYSNDILLETNEG
ncbi:29836_t:CDS:2, partial [Gigaspora margarita]